MKTIKSAWPENANIHRAASNGKTFTRKERINLIENASLSSKRIALIEEARLEIKSEISARAGRFRILRAMQDNPEDKIKTKKDGTAFIQRRVNGKFQPQIVIA